MRRGADEIRDYLLDQLNRALRRPGMYGGELALRLYADALGFTDQAEAQVRAWHQALRERGEANAIGVSGPALEALPRGCAEHVTASVYAGLAHQLGWLRPDRVVSIDDFHTMTAGIAEWCRVDRTLHDVLDTYGQPSVQAGGTSPYHPRSLVYVCAGEAPLALHLWNEVDPRPGDETRSAFPEPVLLAYQGEGATGAGRYGYTPEGLKRKPAR